MSNPLLQQRRDYLFQVIHEKAKNLSTEEFEQWEDDNTEIVAEYDQVTTILDPPRGYESIAAEEHKRWKEARLYGTT